MEQERLIRVGDKLSGLRRKYWGRGGISLKNFYKVI